MKLLVTGGAGFIGSHIAKRFAQDGQSVISIDSINDYYDRSLKFNRLSWMGLDQNSCNEYGFKTQSQKYSNLSFIKLELEDSEGLTNLFAREKFTHVLNFAAYAGVRHSLGHPQSYISSNICGFLNILECVRNHDISHFIYASSSSVYGIGQTGKFSTKGPVDHPINLYAATKRSNELLAHSYSYLYQIPSTGLRFFTVYGPWGRPDMAIHLFTKAIFENRPIDVFNQGDMIRDFTYIDDIVEAVIRISKKRPTPAPAETPLTPNISRAPYQIFNVGSDNPIPLMNFIHLLEDEIGIQAKINYLPLQSGDISASWANVDDLNESIDFRPRTPINQGIKNFVNWFREYYHG